MSTTLAINKDDEVRLVPVPLGPGESLSWPSDLTGRHVFTISWQEKPLQIMAGSFRPLRLWDQKIVREDGKHTKAEPPTLHNYCGPFTVRVKRVIDFPIKPFTPDMLKVMARVGNRCDILDVSVRWEIAEPAITRMTGVKKLTFHLGNVEDVGKLLDWLASPRAKDDRPNLPFLYTLNITCDGGCDLDKLVKCFVQRRSSEKGRPLTLTYGMPYAFWPAFHELESAKKQLRSVRVDLRVQNSEEQVLSSDDEDDEDQASSRISGPLTYALIAPVAQFGRRTKASDSIWRKGVFVTVRLVSKTQKSEYLTIGSIPGFVQCICQVCGQRVISGDGQKRHRLSHLSDDAPKAEETKRPHRCRYCMQGFAQNGTMLSHIRAKHEQHRKLQCTDCGERFADHAGLHRHRKRKHGWRTSNPRGPKSNPTSQKSVARGQASKKRQVTPTTAMPQTDDASTAETTQAPTPPESELRPTAPPHSSSTPRVPFNAPSFPFTFAADTTGAVDFFSINSSEQHVDSLDATPAGAFTLPDHDSLHGYGEEYAAALKMQAPASDFVNEFLPQVKIEPDFAETFDDPGSLAHPFAPIAPSFGSIFSDSTSFPITPTPTLLTRATAAASTSAAVPYDITSTPETSIANSASSSSWYFERNLDACNFDALQSGFDADANYDANFEASTYHWQQMLEPCPHAAGEFFEHEGLASSYAPATAYDDVGEQNLTEMRLQMLYATQTKEYTTQASAYAMDHGGWPTQAYNGEGSSSVDYSASYFGTFTPSCRFDDWP